MGSALSLTQVAGWSASKASRYFVSSLGALIVTNVPVIALGVSHPRTWTGSDWFSDVIPHAVFGVVTVGVPDKLEATSPNGDAAIRRRCAKGT
ncbi:hypothetical protein [Streptomyces sp. NBC_00063]|uniref:hypothetical protein n=1 Tax=Streptomyces sp. NBC_00063 TaxID=2975638 RepID=UPI003D73BADB